MDRRLSWLFLLALLGVTCVVGLALASLGPVVLVSYVLVVSGTAGVFRRRAAGPRRREGSTCGCCTSTVHDPVEVRP